MTFRFEPLPVLREVLLVTPRRHRDARGWFVETYKESAFAAAGIRGPFVQDNHSRSGAAGTLRGLHYQAPPKAQGKLVRCTGGAIFDVAVDLRHGSPTFGRWDAVELSAENGCLLWVPPGFAHGLLTLSEGAEVQYKVTTEYDPSAERTVRWNDPAIGVKWPIPGPVLRERDARAPSLEELPQDFVWR
ncbi:MAG: dTDP-4-dehydrorhamnose 3,5-epimerase [Methanobacteriota archaeon]